MTAGAWFMSFMILLALWAIENKLSEIAGLLRKK